MKAISIRQPWCWAILHAGKRVENRDWAGCAYRGPVLLHASKSVGTRDDFDHAVDSIARLLEGLTSESDAALRIKSSLAVERATGEWQWLPHPKLHRGGIVGRARIVDVIDRAGLRSYEDQRVWWAGGFALVLADVEALPFTPWPGALGLFDVTKQDVRCKDCGQPILPPGVEKKPNEYDHASGCPSGGAP